MTNHSTTRLNMTTGMRRAILVAAALLASACGGTTESLCQPGLVRIITYRDNMPPAQAVIIAFYRDGDVLASCTASSADFSVHPELIACEDTSAHSVDPSTFEGCQTADYVQHWD